MGTALGWQAACVEGLGDAFFWSAVVIGLSQLVIRLLLGSRRVFRYQPPVRPDSTVLGVAEIVLYAAVISAGFPAFIPAWLAVKTVKEWLRQERRTTESQIRFNRYLTGSALAILAGAVLAYVIQDQWRPWFFRCI
jgi:hypothetical protein